MSTAKIAFLLLTHDANAHLERLARALQQFPDSQVFCHHDFSKGTPHPAVAGIAQFCQPHRVTSWATASVMLATLDVLELALARMPEADWFILLSGSCYPIKSPRHIQQFLGSTSANGFLDMNPAHCGRDLPGWWWTKVFTRPLVRIPWILRNGRFYLRQIRVKRRSTPFSPSQPLMYGANWFMLRKGLAVRLMDMKPKEHPILRFYEKAERTENRTMAPEESLVQCLLADHERHGICRDPLRFIDWQNAVNWSPNILGERHWEAIRVSNALFARKFAVPDSNALLDRIDDLLRQRSAE